MEPWQKWGNGGVTNDVSWRQTDVRRQDTWRSWRKRGKYNSLDICRIHFKFCVSTSSPPTEKQMYRYICFLKKICLYMYIHRIYPAYYIYYIKNIYIYWIKKNMFIAFFSFTKQVFSNSVWRAMQSIWYFWQEVSGTWQRVSSWTGVQSYGCAAEQVYS